MFANDKQDDKISVPQRKSESGNDWPVYFCSIVLAGAVITGAYILRGAKRKIDDCERKCMQCEKDLFNSYQISKLLRAELKEKAAERYNWYVVQTIRSQSPTGREVFEPFR